MNIYLDNSATTPLYPEVAELMHELNLSLYANPSSLHSPGRKAKKELAKAREFFAQSINCKTEEIVFTSGATEANNFVFKAFDFDLIITSPSEHPCVLEPAKASTAPIIWLNLDEEGFINLLELETKLAEFKNKKILVSIMHGNNEIGTIQDLKAIGKLKEEYPNFIFHSDCVQTYGKLPLDVTELNLDALSTSAHKLHGPKGVGFLYVKKKILDEISLRRRSLIVGGGQENDLRSGTENLIGILSYAKAYELSFSRKKYLEEIWQLAARLVAELPGARINGAKDLKKRVPGNLNFSFSEINLNSEELLLQLDLAGIAVSSGSACSSNKLLPASEAGIISSYVLRACKTPEALSKKAIRISLSTLNQKEEIYGLVIALQKIQEKFSVKTESLANS